MKRENNRKTKFKTKKESESEVTLRELHEDWEYTACVELQRQTWGESFEDCIPPTILMVSQKVGGILSGAIDADGRLVGFVFGLTGVKDGHLVHWSHMLAVRKEAQGLGIGRRLKLYQRDLAIKIGVEIIYWTYDPLVARNAHLNLNRLGAEIDEYMLDMYGGDLGSVLNRGIGTDRFIVTWHVSEERVRQTISGRKRTDYNEFVQAPIVNTRLQEDGTPIPLHGELRKLPRVRVEVPFDILAIQNRSLDAAAQWRANTRRVFTFYLDRGYEVKTFYRNPKSDRCFYCLIEEVSQKQER